MIVRNIDIGVYARRLRASAKTGAFGGLSLERASGFHLSSVLTPPGDAPSGGLVVKALGAKHKKLA